ncbi:MAG: ATP-binding protein [Deltaproteobacteria bacterium]|nr:ATP-binding protein [Deltaproteobacteria bacterium]
MLINLILNAIQALQEDGVLTIRAGIHKNGADRNVLLEVEDTGVGVSEDDIPRLFDPFFTSRKAKGFGLGLFISRVIVERHNGTMRARSKEGQGTVISVEFPI